MSSFTIEKNIKMPRGFRIDKYPLNDMNTGDSIFFNDVKEARNVVSSANRSMYPKKFSTRTIDGGMRLWRII